MRKNEISERFRSFIRAHLSPTATERTLIATVYGAIKECLGDAKCLQIGSYPRFTAVTPVHDLDVLYVVGPWVSADINPADILAELRRKLLADFKNPTPHRLELVPATHAITMRFLSGSEEILSVDVVPAYIYGRNEFKDEMYVVPELVLRGRRARRRLYDEVARGAHVMQWIKSDPRGYIAIAAQRDQRNDDFRKSVKFVKAWRTSCKDMDESFPLKSFHIEQAVGGYFDTHLDCDIFDAVYEFFCDLPDLIRSARYPDRADRRKKIDEYVERLTDADRTLVDQARDCFLIKLEAIEDSVNIGDLLTACQRERASIVEEYLFDSRIPVLTEERIRITATVLPRQGGFRAYVLNALGLIDVDRKIEFRLRGELPTGCTLSWKVKNDDSSTQPRGEITEHRTYSDPEHTKFRGSHYVECYAVRKGV